MDSEILDRKYWPQNVGCGADDRGRDVSWHPNYRESEPLFGHFTNYECLLGRIPGRPLLHAFFDEALCNEYRHPKSIQGRRRQYQRLFAVEDRKRRIPGLAGRELLATVLPLPARVPDD